MTFRGGHGRTPGSTDSRQGRARGEAYRRQATSGLKGVLVIVGFALLLGIAVTFVADPLLRPWGLAGLALIILVVAGWRWRVRTRRPSLEERLSDLSEH